MVLGEGKEEGNRVQTGNVCEGFRGQAGESSNLSSLGLVISFHDGYNI